MPTLNSPQVKMKTTIVFLSLLAPPAWSQDRDTVTEAVMRFVDLPCSIQIAHDRGVPENELTEFKTPSGYVDIGITAWYGACGPPLNQGLS